MNSAEPSRQSCPPALNKAKAMAVRYQRYCKLKLQSKPKPHLQKLYGCLTTVEHLAARAWNLILPKCIRGPATPYQSLQMNLMSNNCLEGLSLSRISIAQVPICVTHGLLRNRICLLVTYVASSVDQTIAKMHSNQQINGLINKKAAIFFIPLSEQGVRCQQDQKQLCRKIEQFLEIQSPHNRQEQVLILWKGLYQQILIIGHSQLTDPDLCLKTIRAIEEREDYEATIKRLAGQKEDCLCEQSSTNYISEQSTGVSGDSSDL